MLADHRGASVRVVSAADCVDATNLVAEFDSAPVDVSYMRVQHIGDVGTPELTGKVANPVTWHGGRFTGLPLPPAVFVQTQRGYRDNGPPDASSVFQRACNGAGFYVNSHVVQLYDNRAAGTNGAGTDALSADAYTAFVVSPLAAQTADGGAPAQRSSPGPRSWKGPRGCAATTFRQRRVARTFSRRRTRSVGSPDARNRAANLASKQTRPFDPAANGGRSPASWSRAPPAYRDSCGERSRSGWCSASIRAVASTPRTASAAPG